VQEPTTYFDNAADWQANTEVCIEAVRESIRRDAATHVVVATGTGRTAAKFARALDLSKVKLIGVKMAAAIDVKYEVEPDDEACACLVDAGVPLVGGVHALMGGVDSAVAEKLGGANPHHLISHTLYLFSQGMKVAVEVALMAHDHGLVPDGALTIAVGGTSYGADTAILLKAAASSRLFDLRILKVLAKPLECAEA